jgi:hypothetical protein
MYGQIPLVVTMVRCRFCEHEIYDNDIDSYGQGFWRVQLVGHCNECRRAHLTDLVRKKVEAIGREAAC